MVCCLWTLRRKPDLASPTPGNRKHFKGGLLVGDRLVERTGLLASLLVALYRKHVRTLNTYGILKETGTAR